MSIEGQCINKLMDDARAEGIEIGRSGLESKLAQVEKERDRFRKVLEKIARYEFNDPGVLAKSVLAGEKEGK